MGQGGGGGLRVVKHKLAGDGAAFILVREVHAVDPIVRPIGFFNFCLSQRILPQGGLIVRPSRWDGGVASGGGQGGQVGGGGGLEGGKLVDVDKDRADYFAPVFACGNVA